MKKFIFILSFLLQPLLIHAQEIDELEKRTVLIDEIISYKDKNSFYECFNEYPKAIKDFDNKQNKKEIYQKKYLKKLSLQKLIEINNEKQFQYNIEKTTKEFFEKDEPITCSRLYSDFFISINFNILNWINQRYNNEEISKIDFLKESNSFQIRQKNILNEQTLRIAKNNNECIDEVHEIQRSVWKFLYKDFAKKFNLKPKDRNWLKKGCGFNMTTIRLFMQRFENQ